MSHKLRIIIGNKRIFSLENPIKTPQKWYNINKYVREKLYSEQC